MPVKLVLRLVLAATFAVVAIIFSELIPPIEGANPLVARIFVTFIAATLGFIVFPDIATNVTKFTIYLFNISVNRLSSEILNQLLHFPKYTRNIFEPAPQVGGVSIQRPLILDTSAIIDGRILDIAKTGFISGLILIPNFVLLELQQVSDSSDNLKRQRGRRGFDIVSELKKIHGIKIEIWEKDAGGKAVDEKLLKIAKSLHGKVITTDFNLNRLSEAHGVSVLNVNDLSNAIKAQALPGETMEIKIVHVGKDAKQGVGYLEDGTMVVVEDGAHFLGDTVKVEVSRVLQSSAGRIIFGKKQ
ncbi:hypothetical protein A3F00_02140 [Candidatus Daviesbacteria bacterium RIFCSPHIGHO2_12_FULL_37_11]|uniref:TRAM domain-containing protein n=1 Tax=Candidatus Daviesbacteria bacterium RIFCSPHIGHO2_12_FULL_37_11 TaxID=1797777 RepID=A0A1F5KAQ0_9BACT|nr:MAG: hypothetical protein A2769_00310 [Candidatus Daviesbacteria bacterium RIFCSPHIGHO2_01_FULL_37_27]OGE37979.1 MAG: hypothetical protein A3F00_02140 [Candidatus Daviesbacteria bacterium RIFCSPHIGHO2_12_FULL_37_11]OGE46188.1 MAG: hypothetical protein A3B39_00335 [Candidatus Daviesbacteria bacterium RIFCSPLOWO2_01_FULL_37_10]